MRGPDSSTFMLNNKGVLTGSSKAGAYTNFVSGSTVGNYVSLIEASGVDLNNDGKVDIAQHTTNGVNNYALSTMFNGAMVLSHGGKILPIPCTAAMVLARLPVR